ncbi:hypothetical protein KRD06_004166, partial [Escherichia coli O2]|nr:hypothetical protein [Escherichia coli O2]
MSNEYQSTSINPDVFEQFLTLLNTHCKSSETALAMLSTLCYELMRRSGIHSLDGFAPIFPDTCYHLTHYWLAAVDIPVASDNPVHYADAIRYNA